MSVFLRLQTQPLLSPEPFCFLRTKWRRRIPNRHRKPNDTAYQFVPLEEVTNVPYEQEDLLTPDKRVAFKEAYDQAKASVPEGSKLRQVYWFEVPEHYTIDDEHYGKYLFACKGDDVEVTCNGNAMEVVPVTGQTTYFAKITERGVIAISSK